MTQQFLASVAIVGLIAFAAPAFAGQNAVGSGFSSATPGTVGPGISAGFMGNTSNPRPSGHGVLPSEAPGPWACGSPCSGPTTNKGSLGTYIAPTANGGQVTPSFANGKDPGPDFVK